MLKLQEDKMKLEFWSPFRSDKMVCHFADDDAGGGGGGNDNDDAGGGDKDGDDGGGDEFKLSNFIDDAGVLKKGWKEALVPEDLREMGVYDKVTDIQSVLKQAGLQEKMIGKKGVIVPGEHATETEIAAYHTAINVPDKADGYMPLLVKPDEMPEEYWDENLAKEGANLFKKLGITPKQAAGIIAFDNERLMAGITSEDLQDKTEYDEAEKTARTKLGKEYDVAIHLTNRLVSENTEEGEERDRLIGKFGKDPDFVMLAYKLGRKMIEHRVIDEKDAQTGLTPDEARAKAKELQATPGYMDGSMKMNNKAQYDRITKEVTELFKIATPVKPQQG